MSARKGLGMGQSRGMHGKPIGLVVAFALAMAPAASAKPLSIPALREWRAATPGS
jgi:hypothetical protein